MVKDVAGMALGLPRLVVELALKYIKSQIEDRVHFNLLEMRPVKFAETCVVPCVFVIGDQDKLVFPKRVKEIFDAYKGRNKSLVRSEGDHSSEREEHVIEHCVQRLLKEVRSFPSSQYEPAHFPPSTDHLPDDHLNKLGSTFLQRLSHNMERSKRQKTVETATPRESPIRFDPPPFSTHLSLVKDIPYQPAYESLNDLEFNNREADKLNDSINQLSDYIHQNHL